MKGFLQKYGIDYEEIFSPVCRYESIRLLISIKASEGLLAKQFDIKTAFLNGLLDEEINMEIPEGWPKEEGKVCLLRKSLYGLKQAPRTWNKTFIEFITSATPFRPISADSSILHGQINSEKIYLAIYVDDGLILARNSSTINSILNIINGKFKITTRNLENFLGMEITDDQYEISINQNSLRKFLKIFTWKIAIQLQFRSPQFHFRLQQKQQTTESPIKISSAPCFLFQESLDLILHLLSLKCLNTIHALQKNISK